MNLYLLRVGVSKKLYTNPAYIFSISHYTPLSVGEDEYSKKLLYFYKYGNDLNYFLERLAELFKLRFENNTIQFDYIALYPTHKKGGLNPNMEGLVKEFSKTIGLPYKQILRRNKDIKPSHELRTFEERKDNVKESVDVLEGVRGKNIIVLDNTSTTGISLIDITNLLFGKGAKNVACICLGVGSKGRENDWMDLNKTLKYSKIIKVCKGPYVPKHIYEKWKKNR